MRDMHGLRVWDSARELTAEVVSLAQRSKKKDPAGILPQLCRAANSIGANITESAGAASPRERLKYLRIAHRSAWETRHHIRAAHDSSLIDKKTFYRLSSRAKVIVRMLRALIVKLERREDQAAD